ncbi:hypothetical protein FHS91_002510 [Sphingobium xanthum]|uniref:hypothetical protein n=1 Tax=Sphingobium xanthum TaxID=1387165 RepID=UPI001C8BD5E5|nr:hypothetical protein [Sphingobium xanthum]
MATSFLGAIASGAGDDFHYRWVAREILRLLDPGNSVVSIKVEGLPIDQVQGDLGEHGQAVDVALTLDEDGQRRFQYLQLKYSPSHPKTSWTWARLLQPKVKGKNQTSVLGKLAGLIKASSFTATFSIITNQPLAEEVLRDVKALRDKVSAKEVPLEARAAELQTKLSLVGNELLQFLTLWDLDAFNSVPRLSLEMEVVRRLADMTDADAQSDAARLHRYVFQLMLPEGAGASELTREALLVWLGAGATEIFFPAPSRIAVPDALVERDIVSSLATYLAEPMKRPLRLHAEGGCGKTSLVATLDRKLPEGSELFLYDCYGGGLFLTTNEQRHLPGRAFTQIGNEMAGRLRTPFVIRRNESVDAFSAFHRRVIAAAKVLAERSSSALLVLAFDAVDNARTGAEHWQDRCFLDQIVAASNWPENVRIIVTCRTSRLTHVGEPHLYDDFPVSAFTGRETEALVDLRAHGWSLETKEALHDLTGGNPRRLTYALEGLGSGDEQVTVQRLLPQAIGIDPLFETRVKEAGVRIGGSERLWPMLSALARLPRPVPDDILERLGKLKPGEIVDVANDVGGLTRHPEGWAFHDEDFEAFVDQKTADGSVQLLQGAAQLLAHLAPTHLYACRALAELLVSTNDLESLFDLVLNPGQFPAGLTEIEAEFIQSQRLTLGLRACRAGNDIGAATKLLLASAEAIARRSRLENVIGDNLDLSAQHEPETALRLLLTRQRFRKRQAALRIETAALMAREKPAVARKHFHWWNQYLSSLSVEPKEIELFAHDVAAEYRFTTEAYGEDVARERLLAWRPVRLVGDVFRKLTSDYAGSRPASLLSAIEQRSWPPEMLAPIMAAALLAGVTYDEPILKHALIRLSTVKRTRWPRTIDNFAQPASILAWHEATLFLCERALPSRDLHPFIERVMENAFPKPDPQEGFELSRIGSAASWHGRRMALAEVLKGMPISLDQWLPPARKLSGEETKSELSTSGRKSEAENWNRTRDRTKDLLELALRSARATIALLIGGAQGPEAWKTFAAALDADRRYGLQLDGREGNSAFRMIRAHLAHASLSEITIPDWMPAVDRLLRGWRVASTENFLEIARTLGLIPAGHDAALDLLVWTNARIIADPGVASEKAKQQIACSRIALPLDASLSKQLFDDALRSTEKIDVGALTELHTAGLISAAGLGGSRAERLALAQHLADTAGAVSATLDVGGDFDWSDITAAITQADLGAGLACAARWNDRGVVQLSWSLPSLLDCSAGQGLTPEQRYALHLLVGEESLPKAPESTPWPKAVAEHHLHIRKLEGEIVPFVDALNDLQAATGNDRAHLDEARVLRDLFLSWQSSSSGFSDGAIDDIVPTDPPLNDIEAIKLAISESEAKHGPALLEIAKRIGKRQLRVPFLNVAIDISGSDGSLGYVLPEILDRWIDYPPVEQWARTEMGAYLARSLPNLFAWNYRDIEAIEALLVASRIDQDGQAELLLEAIAQNAEHLHADHLFSLVGVIAARVPPPTRNALLSHLLGRLNERSKHPAKVEVANDPVPESSATCVAQLLFSVMGDVERDVRWRATQAAYFLLKQDDAAVEPLIEQLDADPDGVFAGSDFYTFAAREQLMLALWRASVDVPLVVARYASKILESIRATPHLVIREVGRRLLLRLADGGAVTLLPDDRQWLERLNRPGSGAKQKELPEGLDNRRDRRTDRKFSFDDTDTIPYWYAKPAALFGLPMPDFLDHVEGWIHGRWGYGEKAAWWLQDPRVDRLAMVEDGHFSHRHGTRPLADRLSRYLEWHGMMCAVGELAETNELAPDRYGNSFEEWLSGLLPSHSPFWLNDFRTSAPLEKRFWGYPPVDDVAEAGRDEEDEHDETDGTDPWPRSVSYAVFEQEISSNPASIPIAGDYTLRWDDRAQDVDISSALVTPATASALAQALLTTYNRMDFLVPAVREHSEIDEPGYQFIGWLRRGRDENEAERGNLASGNVSDLATRPVEARCGRPGLRFDHDISAFVLPNDVAAINLHMWGAEGARNGVGWRASATTDFLDRLVANTGMTLLICAEIARRQHHGSRGERGTRWALWLYEAGTGLRRIRRIRRGLGPVLVRKAGLTHSVDYFARWRLHHAAELANCPDDLDEPNRMSRLASAKDICRQFHILS